MRSCIAAGIVLGLCLHLSAALGQEAPAEKKPAEEALHRLLDDPETVRRPQFPRVDVPDVDLGSPSL